VEKEIMFIFSQGKTFSLWEGRWGEGNRLLIVVTLDMYRIV
jgi:hypothetical protein